VAIKGSGKIEAPCKTILAAILDTTTRPTWDAQLESITVVEKINAQTRILYLCLKPGYMMSPRDLVILEYWEKIAENHYVVAYSDVSHKTLPANSKCLLFFLFFLFFFE